MSSAGKACGGWGQAAPPAARQPPDQHSKQIRARRGLLTDPRTRNLQRLRTHLERVVHPPHLAERQHLAGAGEHMALQAAVAGGGGGAIARGTRIARAALAHSRRLCRGGRQPVAGSQGCRLELLAGGVQHGAGAVPASKKKRGEGGGASQRVGKAEGAR